MKKWRVAYTFDGYGVAVVEAESKEEAEELFHNGEFEDLADNSENYCVEDIEEIQPSGVPCIVDNCKECI